MTANPTIRAGGSRGRGWGEAGLSIVVPLFNEAVGLATLHGRIVEVARALKAARGLRPRSSMSTTAAKTPRWRSPASFPPTASTSRCSPCRAISARRRRCSPASIMPASAPCCSWTATASTRRRWSSGWSAIGSIRATTWSTPPRPTARTSAAPGRVKTFYSLINWGRGRRSPRTPATSAAVAARGDRAQATARAQPVLQGAGQLDRVPPDPGRLRAGGAHPRQHHLEPVFVGLSIEGLTSFSVAPLRVASLLGLLLAGFMFGMQILIETVFFGQSVPGYPSRWSA